MLLQYGMNGQISSIWSTSANLVHVLGMASMSYIASRSFSGIREAADQKKNCLPPLMLACSRLSLLLSQVSVMSVATAAITLVGATAEWPPLVQYVSAAVAGFMALRLSAAIYLMLTFGQKGSVVSTISSIQSKAGSALHQTFFHNRTAVPLTCVHGVQQHAIILYWLLYAVLPSQ